MNLVPHADINNGKHGNKISVETIPHKSSTKRKALRAALKKTKHNNVDWDNDAWEFATSDEKTVANKCNYLVVAGELKATIPASGQDAEKSLDTETYLFREELMGGGGSQKPP